MPPLRTVPLTRLVKTERTHDENKERAYIAASRRCDRNLEARVDSARRASEIHKKRTGRSLRVTEQDVMKEEMYEEEIDDLPLQYRGLSSHLQTGAAAFDQRLTTYLIGHVAVRDSLEACIRQSYQLQHFQEMQQWGGGPSSSQLPMFPVVVTEGIARPVAATIAERRSVPTPAITEFPQSPFSYNPKCSTSSFVRDTHLFSSALPAESQQLLSKPFGFNDRSTPNPTSSSELLPNFNLKKELDHTSSISSGEPDSRERYSVVDSL